MSLAQAVAAAQGAFPAVTVSTPAGPYPLPVVMVAIAGAESSWNPQALGDYGDGGPTCPAIGTATSFGLWQIHNVHAAYIAQQAGSSDPCVWIPWLFTPAHNAAVAASLVRSPGLSAWTTYRTGAWQRYLGAAQAAFSPAGAPSSSSAPVSSGGTGVAAAAPAPSWLWWAFIGLAVLTWGDVGLDVVRQL